jgi:hypothetical protein
MRVEFRTDDNPYSGKRNELTPRQQGKRVRLIKNRRAGTGKR